MAWNDDGVLLVRAFLNDFDEPPRYSDDRLETLLAVAARLVQAQLVFPVEYAVDVANATITPDPSVGDTRDDNFTNLIATRAACVAERGAASGAADGSFSFSDGGSSVDFRENYKARLAILAKGWCAQYEEMATQYRYNTRGVVGAAVVTPFRLYAAGYQGRRWPNS